MMKYLAHSRLGQYLPSGIPETPRQKIHNGIDANISVAASVFQGFQETVRSTNTSMEVVIMHPEFEIEIEIDDE